MRENYLLTSTRNVCGRHWVHENKGGRTSEFKIYWDALVKDPKKKLASTYIYNVTLALQESYVWEEAAAEVIESNGEVSNPTLIDTFLTTFLQFHTAKPKEKETAPAKSKMVTKGSLKQK